MSIDLEYAIKQDVRNNPVVREVDRDQKREFLRMLGWAVLAVAMLIFALMPRKSLLAQGYKLHDLREQLREEQATLRQYRLELEMRSRPQEVRRRAINELQMVQVPEENLIVVELVPAGSPASHAIVASAR